MKKNKTGFTLIEMLVVITLISVLMGLALVAYQGARKSAVDGKRKADLEQIRSALEMCYADNGEYPVNIYNDITCGTKTYFTGTPKDPISGAVYYYFRTSLKTYTLCALLSVGGVANSCGTAECDSNHTRCNYKLTNP